MIKYLDIYWTYFKTAISIQFQYRASMVIWMIGRVLEPVVYLIVWITVAQARGEKVAGYSSEDFAAYYIILMLVNQFTFSWIMHEFDYRVRQGTLSPMLLKPIHPIHSDIADNLAYKVLMSLIVFPVAGLLYLMFDPALVFDYWKITAFFPALVIGFLMRFFMEWTLAISAFWTTRVSAINQMYFFLELFLSGRLAPLRLLPKPLQVLAEILPFRWAVAFPVELILGQLVPKDIQSGFLMQGLWLVLGLSMLKLLWKAGVKRYSAVGS